MSTIQFETREVTRPASTEEKADLTQRLLEVLSSIDATQEEAKAAASEFRGIIKDLTKREIGLRFNLQTGTVTQPIDVMAVVNENLGVMEYFDRDGQRIDQLTHSLSEKERDEVAMKRQLAMFNEETSDPTVTNSDIPFKDSQTMQDIVDLGTVLGYTPDSVSEALADVVIPDYDPTPEHLDDLQRDHDKRNGLPERKRPASIKKGVQQATDVLKEKPVA